MRVQGHDMELVQGHGMGLELGVVWEHGMERVLEHDKELDHGEVSFLGSRFCLRI